MANVDAYVYRTVLNESRSSRRRARWHREELRSELPSSMETRDSYTEIDEAAALWTALLQLPEGQRQVVILNYYAHLSEADIALVLSIPKGTVKSRLSRGLSALRNSALPY